MSDLKIVDQKTDDQNQHSVMPKLRIVPPIDETWTIMKIAKERCPYNWESVFNDADPELHDISDILEMQQKTFGSFYPLKKNIFRAFELTPMNTVRVVIVGQDPYHQVNPSSGLPRAQGLSFSISRDDTIPSSLRNIYQELQNTVPGFVTPSHGDLTSWARQGILMLNMCLTVRANQAGSHGDVWMGFIEKTLKALAEHKPNTIYILWGAQAQKLQKYIGDRSIILTAAHPSGFSASRGFFGCNHFNKVNEILMQRKESSIHWNLI